MSVNPPTALRRFLEADAYPCVGAKAALAQGGITLFEGDDINRPTADLPFYKALCDFGDQIDPASSQFQSFIAIFAGPMTLTEEEFETALWNRLQALHNLDAATGREWVDGVASDPDSAHFSMSICGNAYFVIGLHPNASRVARRFYYPMLVFNPHEQFEQLRRVRRFDRIRSAVRHRDENLQGYLNPMVDDHGASSEARQYSGRHLSEDWECPLAVQEPLESE